MRTDTIFRACLETGRFTFEAYGLDSLTAKRGLLEALKTHARQRNLPATWANDKTYQLNEIKLGTPYRDREPI